MARLCGRGSSRPKPDVRGIPSTPFRTWNRPLLSIAIRSRFLWLLLFSALTLLPSAARAQNTADDVHINPRLEPPKPKQNLIQDPALRTHTKPYKTGVDLVLVPVTITDPMNRLVSCLYRENFQVYEGKEAQEIKHFSREDAPFSHGRIFESSRRMRRNIEPPPSAVK